jgi:hypothetical protein
MAKKHRFFLFVLIGLVVGGGFIACTSLQPVDVTNTMAVQIASIQLHDLEPGEKVQTIYLARTGSVVKDLNDYQGGVWYRAHQDKIVNLEAVTKTIWWLFGVLATQHQWRVEYVE